ncbi:hypothetical protein [Hymenobacter mucosus]|uniref:Uncharacterized protein n=1 Tax=Hymenobacter mucosus TaxID=1411120 RepID=A0A239ABV3_9BACT|nr:hypothetical protein [Hymenobacter mucosus]SNR92872.1 hypothetical protein SAMN06269173_111126 [Hymenobacter mucosus]
MNSFFRWLPIWLVFVVFALLLWGISLLDLPEGAPRVLAFLVWFALFLGTWYTSYKAHKS